MNHSIGTIIIRFDSYDKKRLLKPRNFVKLFSYNLDSSDQRSCNIKSFVSLKKRSKKKFTVISGPHVHKKSRQQFRIDLYSSFLVLTIKDNKDYINFLNLKRKLYENFIDEGCNITFRYLQREKIKLQIC